MLYCVVSLTLSSISIGSIKITIREEEYIYPVEYLLSMTKIGQDSCEYAKGHFYSYVDNGCLYSLKWQKSLRYCILSHLTEMSLHNAYYCIHLFFVLSTCWLHITDYWLEDQLVHDSWYWLRTLHHVTGVQTKLYMLTFVFYMVMDILNRQCTL